jgi:predicted lipoprotein
VARTKFRSPSRALGFLVALAAVLAIIRPWTVRPLVTAAPTFDATKYAEQTWPRIVAEASRSALDVVAARQSAANLGAAGAPGRRSVFVKMTGTVMAIDRSSRVGLARLRAADGPVGEVTIQIGPVIRGTALRDAASFIQFNDFTNQFEFAAVSNALHERVLRDVVGRLDVDALTGKTIAVLGATTVQAGLGAGAALDIVPIQIQLAGGTR